MKTDRMTLLVTPDEKAELAARANALGISASELVRRALDSYDPDLDEAAVQELADELAQAAARMEKKLDDCLATVAATRKTLADKEGLKAAAQADVEAAGDVWPFAVPAEDEPTRPSA